MTEAALAKAVCDELGKDYAERLFERWKANKPEQKKRREVLGRFQNAVREMYFEKSGVYKYPDRVFLSGRAMDVLIRQAPESVGQMLREAKPNIKGREDIRLEADIDCELKTDVETFGDLVSRETVPRDETRVVTVKRELPDHLFDESIDLT